MKNIKTNLCVQHKKKKFSVIISAQYNTDMVKSGPDMNDISVTTH